MNATRKDDYRKTAIQNLETTVWALLFYKIGGKPVIDAYSNDSSNILQCDSVSFL